MIVYKQVHKKNNKYYSLLNFGYFRLNKSILTNQEPYEIGKTYINNNEQTESIKQQFLNLHKSIPKCVKSGFYFWNKNYPIQERANTEMIKCGASINAVLECEIKNKDILSIERMGCCIRTTKFKILKEVNNVK